MSLYFSYCLSMYRHYFYEFYVKSHVNPDRRTPPPPPRPTPSIYPSFFAGHVIDVHRTNWIDVTVLTVDLLYGTYLEIVLTVYTMLPNFLCSLVFWFLCFVFLPLRYADEYVLRIFLFGSCKVIVNILLILLGTKITL